MECFNCNNRIFGLGCTKTGKRVSDHNTCGDWEAFKPETSIHDQDAIEQYRKVGKILKLGA
jgi:hypothetical protein